MNATCRDCINFNSFRTNENNVWSGKCTLDKVAGIYESTTNPCCGKFQPNEKFKRGFFAGIDALRVACTHHFVGIKECKRAECPMNDSVVHKCRMSIWRDAFAKDKQMGFASE